MVDTLINSPGLPWTGLGYVFKDKISSSEEIVKKGKADWITNYIPVKTDIHDRVLDYHAIYREDTSDVFGVVRSRTPKVVQNTDTFKTFENLMDSNYLSIETFSSVMNGEKVFATFKLTENSKVMDDDIQHYFVVVNNHLKPDGKVTVLHTPVRVACMNILSYAISKSEYSARIPITCDAEINQSLAARLMSSVERVHEDLKLKYDLMYKEKIDRQYVENLLDFLFPYTDSGEAKLHDKANEAVSIARNIFISDCMKAPDIEAYSGTRLQVFQALTDFTQHYYKDISKSFDINYQMKKIPGFFESAEQSLVTKFLKVQDHLAA